MSESSERRQTKNVSGFDIRSTDASSDERSASRKQPCLGPVGTTSAELDHIASLRGGYHARRLARDHRLKIDRRKQKGFSDLSFDDGGFDSKQRFHSKSDGPLRHSPYVAGEPDVGKIGEEFF